MASASAASAIVAGSFSQKLTSTGLPETYDSPKSPRRAFFQPLQVLDSFRLIQSQLLPHRFFSASDITPPLLLSFKSTASTEESPVSRKARIVTPRNTGIRRSSRFNRYFFTNTPLLLHGTNRKHRCRVIELVFFQINAFSKARINADFSRCVFAQHRHIVRRPVFAADREL